MNKRMENRKENRKAFPGFLLLCLAGGLVGAAIGFCSTVVGDGFGQKWAQAAERTLTASAPYLSLVVCVCLMIPAFCLYGSARRKFKGWDGEDEVALERMSKQREWAMLLGSIWMILEFFALSANICYGGGAGALVGTGGFLIATVLSMVLQKQVVDLEKEISPEKSGSVFALNFEKEWEQSCDEAERLMIYRSAYSAFRATNIACVVLWLILTLGNLFYDIGMIPTVAVSAIWLVLSVSYSIKSMRLGASGSGVRA